MVGGALPGLDTALAALLDQVRQIVGTEVRAALDEVRAMRQTDPLLTVEEAAQKLRVEPGTIYNRVSEGRLTHVKDGGKLTFLESDLDAYIQARRVCPEEIGKYARRARLA